MAFGHRTSVMVSNKLNVEQLPTVHPFASMAEADRMKMLSSAAPLVYYLLW